MEKILQIVCVLILVAHVILLIKVWNQLPASLPKHFDFSGKPDSYDSKNTMLMMPILSAGLYVMLTIIERFPKIFNFPLEITETNATFMYQAAREMLVCLKTEIVAAFSYIDFATIETATGAWNGLGPWFLIIFLVAIFGSMGYYIRKMVNHKDETDMI